MATPRQNLTGGRWHPRSVAEMTAVTDTRVRRGGSPPGATGAFRCNILVAVVDVEVTERPSGVLLIEIGMRRMELRLLRLPSSVAEFSGSTEAVRFRSPMVDDAKSIWQLCRDSRQLDLNSSYAYLLLTRDFADTSVIAEAGNTAVGYIVGYVRPNAPDTVFVWQICVAAEHRGQGIGEKMLHHLMDRMTARGVSTLEATVTPGNAPSEAMFAAFARARGAITHRRTLFPASSFPDGHAAEELLTIPQRARE